MHQSQNLGEVHFFFPDIHGKKRRQAWKVSFCPRRSAMYEAGCQSQGIGTLSLHGKSVKPWLSVLDSLLGSMVNTMNWDV